MRSESLERITGQRRRCAHSKADDAIVGVYTDQTDRMRGHSESSVHPLCTGLSFITSSITSHWSMAKQTIAEASRSATLSVLDLPSKIEMSSARAIYPEHSILTMSSLPDALLSAELTIDGELRDDQWLLMGVDDHAAHAAHAAHHTKAT